MRTVLVGSAMSELLIRALVVFACKARGTLVTLILPFVCSVHCYAEPANAAKPVRVGVISGLSGIAAKWNRFQNMGMTLAVEEALGQGERVELVVEDSQTQAPKVISAYNKLLNFDKVDIVLADDFGFVVAPLLPLAKQRQRLLLAISLPHDAYCAQAPGYFFSLTSQFSRTVEAFDTFFKNHPEVRRIALVVFDDPEWGNTYRGIWEALAKKRGIEVVETFLSNEPTPDFKSLLTKLLPKKPQAIFLAHEPESFFKTLRQFKFEGSIVSANNVLEMLADGSTSRQELEGVYVVDPAISDDFRKRFSERFGVPPILEAYAGYEAIRTIRKAFAVNPEHPERGITSVKYEGVAGSIDFTGSSCAGNQSHWGLFRFERGKEVLVHEAGH